MNSSQIECLVACFTSVAFNKESRTIFETDRRPSKIRASLLIAIGRTSLARAARVVYYLIFESSSTGSRVLPVDVAVCVTLRFYSLQQCGLKRNCVSDSIISGLYSAN